MPKAAHKVVVIGHRNPDTDSICSAIAYAELKNKTSDLVCEPRRAGKMNQETEFVLKKFGVKPPRMCTDVNPKIRDVDYREMPGIPGSTSLRKAWEIMRDKQIDTLPVTSPDNELEGVITVKDIATANMDVFDTGILAKSQTTYRNILETLGGTMVVGREDDVCTTGHIRIGTATPEMLENTVEKGDIVILTNRYESQLCAIEKEASLLIICNGSKVGRTIQRIAEEMGVAIMSAPVDTYAAGKLISQCAPISYYMTRSDIMKFTLVTPVADVTRVMAKVRHRYFPILDEDGKYCGMVSRRNIINLQKRRIILVDHNEATQAVEGFDQAEILEIIDHHRIGSLETSGPVYFRNQPVGCTAPSSPRCTTRTVWRSRRRSQAFCWRPSFRIRWCSAAPPAPRWTRPLQSVWQKLPVWTLTSLPARCLKQAKSWTARPPRRCSCRTSRCSCAAISALAWRRAAT